VRFFIPVVTLGMVIINYLGGERIILDGFLLAWLISAFITFLATYTHTLMFLGDPERYLEYALIPSFLLFCTFVPPNFRYQTLYGLILLQLLLYGMYVFLFYRRYQDKTKISKLELIKALNSQDTTIVLSLLGTAAWDLAYNTHHYVCFPETISKNNIPGEEFERFFWRYPLPRPDFEYYIEKYDVGLIPVSRKIQESVKNEGCVYNFDGLEKIFDNGEFQLYKVSVEE
jgi:hypothetical protein